MNPYEVKKNGVSLYMGFSYSDAEDSYKHANSGECFMYRIVASQKVLIKSK